MKMFKHVGFLALNMLSLPLWAQTPTNAAATAPVVAQPAPGASTSSGRIYIPVGEPNIKKVLLAIEPTVGVAPVANDFYETITSNMDFTDLFEILPPSKLPAERGGLIGGTFRFEPYRALGIEFLIKSSVTRVGTQFQAELRLYDVTRGLQIIGRLYPLVSKVANPGRELAHFVGNDIIQALTGEPGIFRTRLLMSCGNRTKEIFIMDFDGQNIRQLTRDKNFALSPSWAPDGRRILFTSYRPAAKNLVNPNLYMVDLVSNERTVLSAARGLNTGGSFHPKENKIAYTFSQNGKPEIYVLDLSSKTRYPITQTLFFSVEPSWAPEGDRLVFSSSKTGQPHIWVANRDGKNAKRLTFAGVYNSSPNWSPRGDRIAFSGQENKRNNFNVFMIDPSGSNLVRLTAGTHSSENPVFSPDGRYLAFSSNEGGSYQIKVMTSLGGRIKTLSPKGLGQCKQPSWSPRL